MRNVTLAYSDDERGAYSDRATALQREPIESACAAAASGANDTTLLELDGYYNFCRVMGVVKLKEQPSTTFWRELYRRASYYLDPTARRSSPHGTRASIRRPSAYRCVGA